MNAQEKWKQKYNIFMEGLHVGGYIDNIARRKMYRNRREAALERTIARLQRELAAAQDEIVDLKAQRADLLREVKRKNAPNFLVQAMNEGDGTYRP